MPSNTRMLMLDQEQQYVITGNITTLDNSRLVQKKAIAADIDLLHDNRDQVAKLWSQVVANLLDREDCKRILVHNGVPAKFKEMAIEIIQYQVQ